MTNFKFKGAVIWSMTALFYLYEVVLRVAPSGITDSLMENYNLTSTNLGILVSAYYWVYFFMQLPCGIIVDKIGARKVITFSSIICAFGTILFAKANCLEVAFIGRALVGLGSACAFISSLKVATQWFSPKRFALLAALTNMMGTLGGNFGGRPLAGLMHDYGWQSTLTLMGYFGFAVALLCFIFMEDKKETKTETFSKFSADLGLLLKNKQIWIAGLVGGILYIPITGVAELWGTPFVSKIFQIDNYTSTWATNLIFIGTAVGSPIFAVLSDKIQSYKKTLQLTSILAGFISLAISFAQFLPLNIIFVLFFLLGFVIGGQVLAFSLAKVNVTNDSYGTAMGLTNGILSFVGLCAQIVMGVILDFFWKGQLSEFGTRIYDAHAYQCAMLSIPILVSFCLVLLYFSREKYVRD